MSEATATRTKALVPTGHLFGFCQSEAKSAEGALGSGSKFHALCPGALDTPRGMVVCTCPEHGIEHERKCHVCRTEVEAGEEYDAVRRQHTNLEACEIAADLRRQQDGHLADQLAQLREETLKRRQTERATANAARQERGEAPVKLRTARVRPIPQRCHCGCGGMTKGGRFVTGHDAKLKSGLRKLASFNNYAELIARGWAKSGELDSRQAEEGQKLIDQAGGPDKYIEQAVAGRYDN